MGAIEKLDPPRKLGEMTLVGMLGEGGMATVYLAAVGDGHLARPAAVKLLRADVPDHDYRTRFLDEARVVVRLHHNNLVDVRAAGEVGDQLYIAMEAIEGRDLAAIWDRCAELGRAFPVPIAVHVVREVLRGLHYAHTFPRLALVHRDVSPSNVLIDWEGAVRLADFGLATSSIKAATTIPGVVFGKVGYMSPEQATRDALDARADVYACGVILWELLTGRPLRSGDSLTTDVVARFDAKAPSSLSRRVDADLDTIVLTALARDPARRYASAAAMLEALGTWLATHAPQTSQETIAALMRELWPTAREEEQVAREELLAAVTGRHQERSSRLRSLLSEGGADVEDLREDVPPGTIVEQRYRVLSRLGRGGMGAVYLAEHLTVGRSVAIKVLTHRWSRNPQIAQRFRAEARAATAAGHPNIAEVFDAGALPDGRLYLVMEYLTGRNLFEELSALGRLEIPRAVRVLRDIGRAVRAAHDVGIIHRDLKPENVMLVNRGAAGEGEIVKVLDFGIAASIGQGGESERLTLPGRALGTPEYMAPEQCMGREPTVSFDIYALGVILFELVAGKLPFSSNNYVEVMARKSAERAPSLATARPDAPSELVGLVDDCLEIDPGKRPSSMHVFLTRLDDVLRALPRASARSETLAGEFTTASTSRGRAPAREEEAASAASLVAAGARSAAAFDRVPAGGTVPVMATEGAAPASRARQPLMFAFAGIGAAAVVVATIVLALGLGGAGASTRGTADRDEGESPSAEAAAPAAPGLTPRDRDGSASSSALPTGDEGASAALAPAAVPLDPRAAGTSIGAQGGRGALGASVAGEGPGRNEGGAQARGGDDAERPSDDSPRSGAAPLPSGGLPSGGSSSSGSSSDGSGAPAAWTTKACAERREEATAARKLGRYDEVDRLLAEKRCWSDSDAWLVLRVRADLELGRYDACVKAGKRSTDSKVQSVVQTCVAKQGG